MIKNIGYFTVLVFLFSCKAAIKVQEFQNKEVSEAPNYLNEENWAVLPSNYSLDLKEFETKAIDSIKADVFYVYPTLNTAKEDLRWNVPIADLEQQDKVLNKVVLLQASAFITSGKLYVPFYRQAHLR
jgi:hypothetical protein